jgi:hypothetical protein
VISSDELDSFRADLAGALRLYKRKTAREIGQRALRQFAKELDDKRERFEDVLSGDSAKILLESARKAVIEVNSNMEVLAGLLKDLASLVAAHRQPSLSGELSSLSDDLAALSGRLDIVK